MLEITEKYTRAAMTAQGRTVWTLLSVLVSLVCVYSVSRDCQEMAACTDELRATNETISFRVGTRQMISTCINLTQTLPACHEKAKKDCQLTFKDTIPYLVLYSNIKESCGTACPIFGPMINCEKDVAYVDLSTDKNAYCRSYIESMECLDSSLINITCSFGDETRAFILDTVYDQDARKFGDGVCMTAKGCSDIDESVTAVTSCLRTWNETRDYSERGTDTLKECISKKATCSDALKMVPFYEESLTGIDVTVPLTTDTAETTTIVTTQNIKMTSSVRSPAPSISITVKTSYTTQPDVLDPADTTEIVTKSLVPSDTTKIVTQHLDPTDTTEIVTQPLEPTVEIVTQPLEPTVEIVTQLLDPTDRTEDTSVLPTSTQTNSTSRDRGRSSLTDIVTAIDVTIVTVKKRIGIKMDPLANTDFVISDDSTNSSRMSTIGVTKISSTNGGNEDDAVMVTSSNRVAEQQEVTTVLSPRRPFSTEESGTTGDEFTTASFIPTDTDLLHEIATQTREQFPSRSDKTDPEPVSINPESVDRQKHTTNIPLRVTARVSMAVDGKDTTSVKGDCIVT
ncbi:hypothetical protein KP79_PYT15822 [Mizuhopecten yessoensis]|uniref:Uncharacterized protein n=1 Tax=Mizuhopecten yessoensis TaxID=6573 RepID=A0A210Q6G9_MIZYE|nr:hypothetical protein KP79_PYT15822 [Mizuhopecten yessoensis]